MQLFVRLLVAGCTIAAIWFVWTGSRRYVADQLGDRVIRQPQAARSALSELRKLGDTAVPALLDTAVSTDRRVAGAARRQLESLMLSWAATRPTAFDAQAAEVVQGLLQREPQLTPSGRRWARRVADQTLRLASSSNVVVGPELVAKVERLLTATRGVSEVADQPLAPPSARRAPPALVDRSRTYRPAPVPPMATQAPDAEPGSPAPFVAEPQVAAVPTTGDPPPRATPITPDESVPATPVPAPLAPDARGPSDLAWQSPQRPSADLPPSSSGGPGATAMGEQRAGRVSQLDDRGDDSFASVSRRQLPHRIAEEPVGTADTAQITREVERMLHGDEADRLRLVEQLLAGRHTNAAPLLLQLARDESPRVRASAISTLGASSNRKLTEAAWRLALRDEDPRVARLAQELQKLVR